jgi:dihydrofolate synthase / folylpolyglutamate synthase
VLARTDGIFLVTRPDSERARDVGELTAIVGARVGADRVHEVERLDDALDDARAWAAEAPKRAVVVTGSIALVGEAMAIAADRGWGRE